MYEEKSVEPISRANFIRRLLRHAGYGVLLVAGSLIVGTVGFHYLTAEKWSDALVNSAMLLGGMGPVGNVSDLTIPLAGKIFAAGFSLYAGLVFIAVAGLIAAPVFHRLLHRFHWNAAKTR